MKLDFPDSSVGKESACNAGDPGSIPGSGRSREGIGYPLQYSWASLDISVGKESTCNAGDLGSIPGSRRSCLPCRILARVTDNTCKCV